MKKAVFWTLTILFPFLLFMFIELMLRLGGYNEESQHLFIEVPMHQQYLAPNPEFVSRYFPAFQPKLGVSHFLKKKTNNTFRIFVMGGSSTQGFPYNFYNSFSSKLEERLLMETKGLNIEVINLGMTAVNSYVIWDLSRKITEYEPDAIIIYAGHNEYYGSFGVASTQFDIGGGLGIKRLILRLKNWRLYQLLEHALKPDKSSEPESRTMMAKVIKEAEILKGGELYKAGIHQFETNISDVMKHLQKHEIPVFIGSLTSNLKDQPPLGDNENALNAYERAEKYFSEDNLGKAREFYLQAKELDPIRFRAPEEMNKVIKETAKTFGASFFDVNRLAAENSLSTIPDSSFFTDHLHPNWQAHQHMADLIFDQMTSQIKVLQDAYASNELFERTRISEFEEIFSEVPVKRLKAGYPFTKGLSDNEEKVNFIKVYNAYLNNSFIDSVAASTSRLNRQVSLGLTDIINFGASIEDSVLVIKHYNDLAYWQIYNEELLKRGIEYAVPNRNLDVYTARILHIVLRIERKDPFFANSLAALYLIQEDLDRAEHWLIKAKKVDDQFPLLWYNYTRYYALRGDSLQARGAYQKYLDIRNAR